MSTSLLQTAVYITYFTCVVTLLQICISSCIWKKEKEKDYKQQAKLGTSPETQTVGLSH